MKGPQPRIVERPLRHATSNPPPQAPRISDHETPTRAPTRGHIPITKARWRDRPKAYNGAPTWTRWADAGTRKRRETRGGREEQGSLLLSSGNLPTQGERKIKRAGQNNYGYISPLAGSNLEPRPWEPTQHVCALTRNHTWAPLAQRDATSMPLRRREKTHIHNTQTQTQHRDTHRQTQTQHRHNADAYTAHTHTYIHNTHALAVRARKANAAAGVRRQALHAVQQPLGVHPP